MDNLNYIQLEKFSLSNNNTRNRENKFSEFVNNIKDCIGNEDDLDEIFNFLYNKIEEYRIEKELDRRKNIM